jgi:hypothetical protein
MTPGCLPSGSASDAKRDAGPDGRGVRAIAWGPVCLLCGTLVYLIGVVAAQIALWARGLPGGGWGG